MSEGTYLNVHEGSPTSRRKFPPGSAAALAAGAQAIAVTTDLTRQKVRDSEVLDRSHVVDDPKDLPALVRHSTGQDPDQGEPD
jgi:hypothetical protein